MAINASLCDAVIEHKSRHMSDSYVRHYANQADDDTGSCDIFRYYGGPTVNIRVVWSMLDPLSIE